MADEALFKNFVKPLVLETQNLVGGIKRVMAVPCDIDVAIWVETFAKASLNAFYDVIEPDPKEAYHKTTGKSFVCDLTTALEQGAKKLPESAQPATRFLFKGLAVYDIATWWFFLADVAFEGGYKWTSALYRQAQCPNKGSPNHGTGVAWGGGLQPNGAWGGMDFAYNVGSKFYPVAPSGFTVSRGGFYTGGFTAEWHVSEVIVPTPCRMRYLEANYNLDYYEQESEGGVAKGMTHVFDKGRNTSGEVMTVLVEWNWNDPSFPPFTQCFPTDRCHSFVSST